MKEAVKIAKVKPKSEILWASTRRELFNIFQAEESKCQIITVPHDILNKFNILGKGFNSTFVRNSKNIL